MNARAVSEIEMLFQFKVINDKDKALFKRKTSSIEAWAGSRGEKQ